MHFLTYQFINHFTLTKINCKDCSSLSENDCGCFVNEHFSIKDRCSKQIRHYITQGIEVGSRLWLTLFNILQNIRVLRHGANFEF